MVIRWEGSVIPLQLAASRLVYGMFTAAIHPSTQSIQVGNSHAGEIIIDKELARIIFLGGLQVEDDSTR